MKILWRYHPCIPGQLLFDKGVSPSYIKGYSATGYVRTTIISTLLFFALPSSALLQRDGI